MTDKSRKIIEIEIPVAEASDLTIRAARVGMSLSHYAAGLVMLGAYGISHPIVVAFRKRAKVGICGTETPEGES